jgi:two-component system response regulator GlrR
MARRIVIITDAQDDGFGVVGPLLGALSDAGADPELFTDCDAGLTMAAGGLADLVVIDLDAPSLGGIDGLVKIGRVASRTPVLLLAGESNRARRMWAVEVGVIGYVTKPADGRAVARFIEKVLNGF